MKGENDARDASRYDVNNARQFARKALAARLKRGKQRTPTGRYLLLLSLKESDFLGVPAFSEFKAVPRCHQLTGRIDE
jgi:hypothetical protein